MENESSRGEPLKEKSVAKMRNRKDKQATVLKQLNNQNLYPLQERIGIYIIAALSALGLILITYTGVMALVSNAANGDGAANTVDVDEVSDILDELDELLDSTDEHQNQGAADLEYGNETDGDDITRPGISHDGIIGRINDNMVQFRREPGGTETMTLLHEGYEVTIIDLDYNAYWSHVLVETDLGAGLTTLEGFVYRRFIDIENE